MFTKPLPYKIITMQPIVNCLYVSMRINTDVRLELCVIV